MMTHILRLVIISACIFSQAAFAQIKEIAITIDDLPFIGSDYSNPNNLRRENERLVRLINTLNDRQIPVTGFVIAGSIAKGQWELLERFKSDGYVIGNHTYSHHSLNGMSAEKYMQDVERADHILTPLMTGKKYFRYPYLAESSGAKKQQVHNFLFEHGYEIAPVTVDSKDFQFNQQFLAISWRVREKYLPQFKRRYLAYIWAQTLKAEARSAKQGDGSSRQVLLVHANLLNSHLIGDVIDMYQNNGYTIVSLEQILHPDAMPKAGIVSPVLQSIFGE